MSFFKDHLFIIFLSLTLFVLGSCSVRDTSKSKTQSLTLKKEALIIASTDFHGALEGENLYFQSNKVTLGGAPLLHAYVSNIKEHFKIPTFQIDAGDMFQGTLVSNVFEGKPVIEFYNMYGMDAVAVGNHEFDYGPSGENAVPRSKEDNPTGAIEERSEQAKFPFLAVNVRKKTSKNSRPSWLKPSVLLEKGEIKLGVIGATSKDTANTTISANLRDLQILENASELINTEAKLLRDQGADYVVLTMHDGASCLFNSLSKLDDIQSCSYGTIFDVAKKLDSRLINVIVAGHTHSKVLKRVNGILIMQPLSHGRQLAWAKLSSHAVTPYQPIDICSHHVLTHRWEKKCDEITLNKAKEIRKAVLYGADEVLASKEVSTLIKPYLDKVKEVKKESTGVEIVSYFGKSYANENAAGNLSASLIKSALNSDIGLQNNGGVRKIISKGELLYEGVYNAFPFDNNSAVMNVTPRQLRVLVAVGASSKYEGYSWSGIKATIDGCDNISVEVNGRAIYHPHEPSKNSDMKLKRYSVGASDFLVLGGSGVSEAGILQDHVEIFYHNKVLRDLIFDELKNQAPSKLSPKDYYDKNQKTVTVLKPCDKFPTIL